jgi:hypothetical protein
MQSDIRSVALMSGQRERVAAATQALAAHAIQARLSDWDGTRCDLVVANADDGYGRHVIEIARRRGLAVVALRVDAGADCRAQTCVDAAVSEQDLAIEMLRMLRAGQTAASAGPARDASSTMPLQVVEAEHDLSMEALPCRLALDPEWTGHDLVLRLEHRRVYLVRSRGRVLTSTLSEQLSARDHLCDPGWSIRRLVSGDLDRAHAEVSTSLDGFLLRGVLRGLDKLPPFPRRSCALADWPDLGAEADQAAALKVAGVLSRGAVDSAELAALAAVDARLASACLWAFAAAGLLQFERRNMRPNPSPVAPATGLLAKLARHFGLARAA